MGPPAISDSLPAGSRATILGVFVDSGGGGERDGGGLRRRSGGVLMGFHRLAIPFIVAADVLALRDGCVRPCLNY